MKMSQWQKNVIYSLVDNNENHGTTAGGKQSPSNSDTLSPRIVGGKDCILQ